MTAVDSRSSAPWGEALADELGLDVGGEGRAVKVIDVTEDYERIDDLLSMAYAEARVGDRVVVVDQRPRAAEVSDATGRTWRDLVTSTLFTAGFVRTRVHESPRVHAVIGERSELLPPPQRDVKLSVVMPVYNEISTIREVMEVLLKKSIPGVEFEFVVVESNSTDGTREAVVGYESDPRVHVVLEEHPKGKGHAVRTGITAATGDYLIIQDADNEYDVDDYDKLIAELTSRRTSFVLGVRASTVGARSGVRHFADNVTTSRVMNIGHVVFLTLFNFVYRSDLADPFTMFKVLRRDCLNGVILRSNRFDFDWELVGKLLRLGYVPTEVLVSYHSRSFTEGKKISVWRDPLTWIVACLRYKFEKLEY